MIEILVSLGQCATHVKRDVRRCGDQALVMALLCQSLYRLCDKELRPRMVVVVVAIEHSRISETSHVRLQESPRDLLGKFSGASLETSKISRCLSLEICKLFLREIPTYFFGNYPRRLFGKSKTSLRKAPRYLFGILLKSQRFICNRIMTS